MHNKLSISLLALAAITACSDKPSTNEQQPAVNVASDTIEVTGAQGHFLSNERLFYYGDKVEGVSYELVNSGENAVKYRLNAAILSDSEQKQFPHLVANGQALSFAEQPSLSEQKQLLKAPLFVQVRDTNGNLVSKTRVQTGNAIDALYTNADNDADEVTDLGSMVVNGNTQFKLWAPTARAIDVLLFNKDKTRYSPAQLAMQFDVQTGVWQATAQQDLSEHYYQYQIEVFHPATGNIETIVTTDPYSLSLSANSEHSQVINLDSASSKPEGWDEQDDPSVANFEDNVFYELHIRDFSAVDNTLSSEAVRGKYAAFKEADSDGARHLQQLRQAGLNNIHLLPAFDIGTVNEVTEQRVSLSDTVAKLCEIQENHLLCSDKSVEKSQTIASVLQSYDSQTQHAQAVVSQLRSVDDYNWGYDPFHYTVPEGSYAQNPDGVSRIVEFRDMVQTLHNMGFRVIMDVVYNHTHQAGLEPTAVLDKIVPGYYQRLNPVTGAIEQSTCCDNTATERKMMAKLMTDSLVVWAGDYKIDGFRFDLMAHQPKDVMLASRQAVQAVDADTYFYGEGWNFGEVANNKRFEQASQLNLGGTEIGTFTDRLRDAVRGGGMTSAGDDIRKQQGIGNGLYTLPNELRSEQDSLQQYLLFADQLRVGLAANLASYPLVDRNDKQVTGADVPYGDQPSGYALDPADTINYVSKHDNQTLWDNNQYRIHFATSTEDRVRMQALGLSYAMLAQGIPFIHMGSELLRSKSYLRDSYDYGDWFNAVDFGKQGNNYNVGLPPAEKDQQNWQVIGKIIEQNQGRDIVNAQHISFMSERFIDLLKIRMTSPLLRLSSAEQINAQLRFLNTGSEQTPGLIVMQLTDSDDIDPDYQQMIVIFNSSPTTQTFAYQGAAEFSLHPVLQQSSDALAQQHAAQGDSFRVEKFSAAVFVRK
ncbi:pullulanase-type alpha-1,6-glucosidase [Thalassotalea sp. HSM 43]|uniref:pullulanase-type alpha-1,6-glucosidase n=1 Tax=Thalassotalea sp. HSM 43 TaxID=2552945 RepID=UPI0010809EFE|nr:pullulanase-type alpha-1,6-glucosidase [Thalassotalea sp. HSM 43]QBY04331.1 pullulanase-type alpha-1,6-glucosidase [Thalassotalea sp. HSM 43]